MNVFKDGLAWMTRDLRQVALSYFDPIVIIGKNISGYVAKVEYRPSCTPEAGRVHVADDFAAIRDRMKELRREHDVFAQPQTHDDSGAPTSARMEESARNGQSWRAQESTIQVLLASDLPISPTVLRAFRALVEALPATAAEIVTSDGGDVVDQSPALIAKLQSADIIDLASYRELHQSRNVAASVLGTNATTQFISALSSEASDG